MGERDESIGWFLVLALTSAHCPGHARVSTPLRALPKVREMAAALGSAFQLRAAARPALTRRGKKTSTKARARATPVRAASTEPKIESVAAAVPSDAFLPDGLYCVDNTQTIRRKTRCVSRRVIAAARRGPRRDSTAQTSGSRYSLYVISSAGSPC